MSTLTRSTSALITLNANGHRTPGGLGPVRASILRALGRPELDIDLEEPRQQLVNERILITGAAGAIGRPLTALLREWDLNVQPTDMVTSAPASCVFMDVTDFRSVLEVVSFYDPTIIFNLAATKLAVPSEIDPWSACTVNLDGAMNLLRVGRRIVQASTCKAGDAFCAYGHTKALAERLVLNHGGTVARFYNVPECGPSMVDVWTDIPEDEPIPVTPCSRYIITHKEALALLVWASVLPKGRYAVNPGEPHKMTDYAERYFPGRAQIAIPPRRGDRIAEPLHGKDEAIADTRVPGIRRIENPNDF